MRHGDSVNKPDYYYYYYYYYYYTKMQNLQITFAYIKKLLVRNLCISFLLCVWLAQICSPRLSLYFNRKVFFFLYKLFPRFNIQILVLYFVIIQLFNYRHLCVATEPIMFNFRLFLFLYFFYSPFVSKNFLTDSHQISTDCVFWFSLNNPVCSFKILLTPSRGEKRQKQRIFF